MLIIVKAFWPGMPKGLGTIISFYVRCQGRVVFSR